MKGFSIRRVAVNIHHNTNNIVWTNNIRYL